MSNLFKETIKGIPRAAANLAKSAGEVMTGTALTGYGISNPGASTLKRGISDFRNTMAGRPGNIKGYKKGGHVKKTGLAYLHKGERVIPAAKVKALARMKK